MALEYCDGGDFGDKAACLCVSSFFVLCVCVFLFFRLLFPPQGKAGLTS